MNVTNRRPLHLLYEGSVKRVWRAPQRQQRLWFEFTDDYSVFDWGKMPDTIANKGRALAVIGTYLFETLAKPEFWQALPNSPHLAHFDQQWLQSRFAHPLFSGQAGLTATGAPHHFQALVSQDAAVETLAQAGAGSEPLFMEVLEAAVHRPVLSKILHQSLYVYPTVLDTEPERLIPLEIVFRFGMPGGSSLTERLKKNPEYASELGISSPTPGQLFVHPVLEFYTKLEAKDRLLSWQEAILLSQLSASQFEELVELALDTALALYVIFAQRKIEVWDGKVEMVAQNGKPILADSIGPDELRLLYQGCQLSKEMIRQIYRGSDWELKLKEAQRMARLDNSRSWKEIAVGELKASPEPIAAATKHVIDQLYGVLANHLVGQELFAGHPSLERFASELPPALKGEDLSTIAGRRADRTQNREGQ